jgi:hypothetical protein
MNTDGAESTEATEGTESAEATENDKRAEGTLERRYRRLLTLLPGNYRQARGEELLSTLLDASPEGRRWPHLGEVASLGLLAARVRTGATTEVDGQQTDWREAFRIAALCGAFFFAVPGAVMTYAWITGDRSGLSFMVWDVSSRGGPSGAANFLTGAILPVLWLMVFIAQVFDFRRTALAIAFIAVATGHWCVAQGVSGATDAAVATLTFLAMVPSSGRSLPPPAGRWRWLGSLVASAGVYLVSPLFAGQYAFLGSSKAELGVVAVIGIVAVVGVFVTRAPSWPVIVAVIGAPFYNAAWPDGDGFVNGGVHILQGYYLEPLFIVAAALALVNVAAARLLQRGSGGSGSSTREDPPVAV